MADEPEVETKDLQEALDELHEEQKDRAQEELKNSWTRYISLTTAILAVLAAIGSLKAGSLVNEAQIDQLRASDSWNEYQASKEKGHLYTIKVNDLLDAGVIPSAAAPKPVAPDTSAKPNLDAKESRRTWIQESKQNRLKDYISEVGKEDRKQGELSKKATGLGDVSKEEFENHERFALSVTLIQVAIALGAISALSKVKWIWYLSMACGLFGFIYFTLGFLHFKRGDESARPPAQTAELYRPGSGGRSPRTTG
jgi:hypothetical protein